MYSPPVNKSPSIKSLIDSEIDIDISDIEDNE